MTVVEEIVALLIQFEPQIQAGILALIKVIKEAHDKGVTAEQAEADAAEALGLMLGRMGNVDAEAAGANAAVDADAANKFKA